MRIFYRLPFCLLAVIAAVSPGCIKSIGITTPPLIRVNVDVHGGTKTTFIGQSVLQAIHRARLQARLRGKSESPNYNPDPGDIEAWLKLGRHLESAGDIEQSKECYLRILADTTIMASEGDIPVPGHSDVRFRRRAEKGMQRIECCPAKFYCQLLEKEKEEEALLMAIKSLERVGTADSLTILEKFKGHKEELFRLSVEKSIRRIRRRMSRER